MANELDREAIGASGDFVGSPAVVLSLVYVGFQVRQNSNQIDQSSRQLEASMYHASGERFHRWWPLIAHARDTRKISRDTFRRILASPGGRAWWVSEARRSFTEEFGDEVERLMLGATPSDRPDTPV